ncbi:hypothetical protein [Plantactinospora soyae]|uniref:Uncharacterized protein n=1 Tax=Plantactinospora soyae TaxID=1544732 RepID=A0A927R988_9ACTN|nr:hypothetical protein [Plantactinospora soyae]MBE1491189.1 hypothetical protein [Plantactinospora soyae]
MRRPRQTKPYHRRYWRYLWRYCRCGYRWRCPDSVERVPMPYEPTVPPLDRPAHQKIVRAAAPVPTRPEALAPLVPVMPDAPVPPGRIRPTNRRTGAYSSGRNALLTSAPANRARHAERGQG